MRAKCYRCDRPLNEAHTPTRSHRPVVQIRAVHGGYGCDSGCCGFRFIGTTDHGEEIQVADFDFTHSEVELKDALAALSRHFNCHDTGIDVAHGCELY